MIIYKCKENGTFYTEKEALEIVIDAAKDCCEESPKYDMSEEELMEKAFDEYEATIIAAVDDINLYRCRYVDELAVGQHDYALGNEKDLETISDEQAKDWCEEHGSRYFEEEEN